MEGDASDGSYFFFKDAIQSQFAIFWVLIEER